MSRPPKIIRLKPEENQPLLEAYVSDLFSPLSISTAENKMKQTVTPGNAGKTTSANSAQSVARNTGESISTVTSQ